MILVGDYVSGNKSIILNHGSEIILCNLEGPLLSSNHTLKTSPKAGPSIYSTDLPNGNTQFVFTLANNHIMDYGYSGLVFTQEFLNQKNFKYCGAGKDVNEARNPTIIEDNGVLVGIISCCEAQFGVARNNQSGIAEVGSWVYEYIKELNKSVVAVIVSVHAANEDSPWPSPYFQELYHSFIDAGAKVVHGHHSHVPQGYEIYNGGLIFYGMGNFVVDPDKWHDYPNGLWSLAAKINFSIKPLVWEYLTLEIRPQPDNKTILVEESNNSENLSHVRYLKLCNQPFEYPTLLPSIWQEVALRTYYQYGANYMRFSIPTHTSRLNKVKTGLLMLKNAVFKNNVTLNNPTHCDYLLWFHMISCESHRQMLLTALGVLSGEIIDLRNTETKRIVDEMMPWSRKEIIK